MPNEFIPFGGAAETLGWDAIYNGGVPFQVGALITAASTNAALRMSSLVAAAVGKALGLNPSVDASLGGVTANSFLAGATFGNGVLKIPNAGLEINNLKVTTSINFNNQPLSTTGQISGGSLNINNKATITGAGVISTSQTDGGTTTGVQLSPAGDITATGAIAGSAGLNINNKATIDSDGDITTNGAISGASLSIASGTVAITNTGISTTEITASGDISGDDISGATVSARGELSGDSLNIAGNATIDNAGKLTCTEIEAPLNLGENPLSIPSLTLTNMSPINGSGSGQFYDVYDCRYEYVWESNNLVSIGLGLYLAICDYTYRLDEWPEGRIYHHQSHIPLLILNSNTLYQNEIILSRFTSSGPTGYGSSITSSFGLSRTGSAYEKGVGTSQSCGNIVYDNTTHTIKIGLQLYGDYFLNSGAETHTPPVVTVKVYKLFSIS